MKTAQAWALAAILALGALSHPAVAADAKPAADRPAGVRGDVLLTLTDAEKKLEALAEAMPADKYTWRPAQGVRSVGEVFLHVAAGNYELGSFWGLKTPAGVDVANIEKDGGDKAKAIAAMKSSFELVRNSILGMSDKDLDREINLFGRKATVRTALLITASHAHEHLGQAIAYARSNNVTPPWSRGSQSSR